MANFQDTQTPSAWNENNLEIHTRLDYFSIMTGKKM